MFVSHKNTLLTVDEGGNFREYSLEDYKMINSLKQKLEIQLGIEEFHSQEMLSF